MRDRAFTLVAGMAMVLLIMAAPNLLSQDLIFTDDFEWGSICAWSNLWYPDVDDDSWGDESAAGFGVSCPPPDFSVANNIDCVDSDPMVNPGALEVSAGGVDDDCDGDVDEIDTVCPTPYSIYDPDPVHASESIGLCQTTSMGDPRWGVLVARFIRAQGDTAAYSSSFAMLPSFGLAVVPQQGDRFLGLSTGNARDEVLGGGCGDVTCSNYGSGTAPPGFPQDVPGCLGGTDIHDDIGFEVTLRAPTNAVGLIARYKFHSFEWPRFVCTEYNDQFVVLMDPPPPGAINGNIAVDANSVPVSVNSAYMEVCNSLGIGDFAFWCTVGCPPPPYPYCPLGSGELVNTGFLTWDPANTYGAGATPWVEVTAPVVAGEDFSLRFLIWDTGDSSYDSTVLIDAFEWVLAP